MKEMEKNNSNTRTDTTRFILPQLGHNREDIITDTFVNSYLWQSDSPEEEEHIHIAYTSRNRYLDENTTPDLFKITSTHYIYSYKIPGYLYNAVNFFIQGKYSKFTQMQKYMILSFWGVGKGSRMSSILYPKDFIFETSHQTLLQSENEIWPKPNTINETFVV